MKKLVAVSLTILSGMTVFSSCTPHADIAYRPTETDTVRHAVKQEMQDIQWTTDITGGTDNPKTEASPSGVFNEQMAISFGPGMAPVYPELPGFGSLDTTDISPSLQTALQSFLTALKKNSIQTESFHPEYRFAAVIARYQLEQLHTTITSCTVGKPFIAGTTPSSVYEIPVLVSSDDGKWILRLYLEPEAAEKDFFALEQISFEELHHE